MSYLKINGIYKITEEINGEVDTGEFISDYDVQPNEEVIVTQFDEKFVTTTENPQREREATVFNREEFEKCSAYMGNINL